MINFNSLRCVDIGGTKCDRADITAKGRLLRAASIQTPKSIEELTSFIVQDLPVHSDGISIATAGTLNGGQVICCPNAPFLEGVDLAKVVEEASGKACRVYNDMEALTTYIGNELLGPYFLVITISSGVGGRVWRSGIVSPCEIGHTTLDTSDSAPICKCGNKGCAEAVFGGHVVRARVIAKCKELSLEIPDGTDPCAFLDASYDRAEEWAIEEYAFLEKWIAIFLANLQATLYVPFIVWTGSMATIMLPKMEASIRQLMEEKFQMAPAWVTEKNFRFIYHPDFVNETLRGAEICFRSS